MYTVSLPVSVSACIHDDMVFLWEGRALVYSMYDKYDYIGSLMVMFSDGQDDDDDPLNSDDDADSDEGDDAVWETDNTIVCQFEKVGSMSGMSMLYCTWSGISVVHDKGFV